MKRYIIILLSLMLSDLASAQQKIWVFNNGVFTGLEADSISLVEPATVKKDGMLPGGFSVSETQKVRFSMGNLQYKATTDEWRFAEVQYDTIGSANANASANYDGWIDLFGWGTSGWSSGAACYQPYSTSLDNSAYYVGSNQKNSLVGDYANADWGVYNKISNGLNKAGEWRTFTSAELKYLLDTRENALNLRGEATICGVTGLILLPDDWQLPSGVTFTPFQTTWSLNSHFFTTNVYDADQWRKMELAGAVFLPAEGYREKTNVNQVGVQGNYWTSSSDLNYNADYLLFYDGVCQNYFTARYVGFCVRLVKDM